MPVAPAIVRRSTLMTVGIGSQRLEARHPVAMVMMRYHHRQQHDNTCQQHDITDYLFFRFHNFMLKNRKFILQLNGKCKIYHKKTRPRGHLSAGQLFMVLALVVYSF